MVYYESNYLMHHGIKGQKWGVRRYQNSDGTFTAAGKRRYLNSDGTLNQRGVKAQAKAEYKARKKDISKRYKETNKKFDKQKADNLWGFESGGIGARAKGHIKNEYDRSKALNKLDQERLDAKREYRNKIGKKKTDTMLMKIGQKNINEIANQSMSEFTRDYVMTAAKQAISSATQARDDYNWSRK